MAGCRFPGTSAIIAAVYSALFSPGAIKIGRGTVGGIRMSLIVPPASSWPCPASLIFVITAFTGDLGAIGFLLGW